MGNKLNNKKAFYVIRSSNMVNMNKGNAVETEDFVKIHCLCGINLYKRHIKYDSVITESNSTGFKQKK